VNAIEAGRYVPNTAVALRLARALGCPVEELFRLDDALVERQVQAVVPATSTSTRAVLVNLGGRLVAHPLVAEHAIQEGFASADAVLFPSKAPATARLLVPQERVERTALVLGCDPSLRVLSDHLARRSSDARLTWLSASSRQSLNAVARGEAHLAGSHLRDSDGGYNLAHAREALGLTGGLVITLASWEQGFVVAPGNPKAVRTITDLARPDVRLVNREPGAGCRQFLDELLSQEGIPKGSVPGYSREVPGHLAVARAVSTNAADVGIALRAAAEVYGLAFVPLAHVRFDLVIPRTVLGHPAVSMLLELLQGRALREELAALPGYEVTQTGEVAADIPAAA
jgi:molybdate-binding protein